MVFNKGKIMIEHYGIDLVSWDSKVRDLAQKWLGNLHNINVSGNKIVKNIHLIYVDELSKTASPVDFETRTSDILMNRWNKKTYELLKRISDKTKINSLIVDRVMRAIYYLSSTGKIPIAKWNPAGYDAAVKSSKQFESEKGFFDKLGVGIDKVKIFAVVAGLGISYLLLSKTGLLSHEK